MTTRFESMTELLTEINLRRLSRRDVLRRAAVLGLSAPVIASLLAACGDDTEDAEDTSDDSGATTPESTDEPETDEEETEEADSTEETDSTEEPDDDSDAEEDETETEAASGDRGAGDQLRILNWQAPDNLNPHFSQGYHNSAPARMVLEPLLSVDENGDLHAVLVEEVPSSENGGISEDGRSVTYTLLEGLVWADGEPMTSEDAVFTWEWVSDEATGAASIEVFANIEEVEIVDERTFTVHFANVDPAWYNPFSRGTGLGAPILPMHIMDDYRGTEATNAPFNLEPVGTGPYKVVDFRPGDVIIYEINENYRDPDKPYFSSVEFKGGGDAASAARAVFQTGDADYAPNLQVEAAVLDQMLETGNGELLLPITGNVEQIFVQFADPNTEVDGARSEPSTEHPFLTDPAVREALALASDRDTIAEQLYGVTGEATPNIITAPANFVSPNTSYEYNLERAREILDEAGWVMNGDYREKDGMQMSVLFQTTINPLRQKTQEILKDSWEAIGIQTELKTIEGSVFFSSDAGNPDTWSHFYADLQMATLTTSPFPAPLLRYWASMEPEEDLAQASNDWTGRNLNRWVNEEFNELYQQLPTELDPDRQAELFYELNDLVVMNYVNIPLVSRTGVYGKTNEIQGVVPTPWDEFTYDIANWYREA